MPRANDTPVCAFDLHAHCVREEVSDLVSFVPGMDPNVFIEIPKEYENICGCLPDCYSVIYDAELSQTNLRETKFLNMSKTLSRIFHIFGQVRTI
jgi:hypothetical protein